MSLYMYGLRVTPKEEVLFNKILTEASQIEKVRHFRAVHGIARRNNVDVERAEQIYNNNGRLVRELNKNSASSKFFIGKNGAVCERLSNGPCPKIRELPDKDIYVNRKPKQTGLQKFIDKIRDFAKTVRAFFAID